VKVFITPAADKDIGNIGNWIAGENPKRAISFMLELQKACEAIGDVPKGSVVVQRYVGLEIRRKPYRDYLIFYRIKNSTVEILHVIHGARDYVNLF
jgi:toxin ParE1/3/4